MQSIDEENFQCPPAFDPLSNAGQLQVTDPVYRLNIDALQNLIIGFRAVLDQTGTYIFTKDTAGVYTYVNQMVAELFGDTLENIVGKDDSHFFDLELAHDLRLHDRLVIDEGKTIEKEEKTS